MINIPLCSCFLNVNILIQIAEFYDVEIKELLNGERKGETMNKELKETLSKVADYSKLEKQIAAKIGNIAFGLIFIVCAVMIIIQLLVTGEFLFVIGETVAMLVGGIGYTMIMIHNGIWETGSGIKSTPMKDAVLSLICSGIFSVILVLCYIQLGAKPSQITSLAMIFFIGITIVGFVTLRAFAYLSRKRDNKKTVTQENEKTLEIQPVNIFMADGMMQANMIIEALKRNEIPAYTQDMGDAGFASVRYGMGRGLNDRMAIFVQFQVLSRS